MDETIELGRAVYRETARKKIRAPAKVKSKTAPSQIRRSRSSEPNLKSIMNDEEAVRLYTLLTVRYHIDLSYRSFVETITS